VTSANQHPNAALSRRLADNPIAIVGLSCLFPEAPDVASFWSNIVAGRDCTGDVPETHWRIDDYYDPDPATPDKTYCRRGGFVPPTAFNPIEFGLPPTALDVTDILQLLSLVVAKGALRDAGYEQKAFDRERTGVILGITGANSLTTPLSTRLQYPVWRKVLNSRGFSDEQADDIIETIKKAYAPWEENSFPGMLGNVVAGRISNRLDLGATNCTVDAACASSLSAMRMAIAELTDGRADMMITGGCDAENTILMYMCFSKTPAFSKKGVIRPFDVESDGTLIGEGMGMLVLKRLADAERDGDRIYAVIRGLGSSSDGRFKSIYAPRAEGQVKCLNRAYEDAGIAPHSVGLIEAHGTGTAVGDATEASSLRQVMSGDASGLRHIALGSVKSQIGHTKAAAGAAGAIKAALALHHRVLPPTIHVENPNPALGLDGSTIYINAKTRPWFANYGVDTRYAGVSSFGFGGTNFHLVLEEYAQRDEQAYRLDTGASPVFVSAPTPEALETRLEQLRDAPGSDPLPFDAQCAQDDARIGFVAADRREYLELIEIALTQLRNRRGDALWQHPRGIRYRRRGLANGKIAALFSGQGSQHVGMGSAAVCAYPPLHARIAEFDTQMVGSGAEPLSGRIYPPPAFEASERDAQAERLRDTRYAQPAIGALSAAQFDLFRQAGLSVDMVGGHSFGELTALWAAGALDDAQFRRLACARGRAMAEPGVEDPGTMIAVKAPLANVEALLQAHPQVWLCNQNTPEQQVVGGTRAAVAAFRSALSAAGIAAVDLPVSGAFHTPLLEGSAARFVDALAQESFAAPRYPVYRNRDGETYPNDPAAIRAGLGGQLLEPVRFTAMIEAMYRDGARVFVEFGPKGLLGKMVSQILGDREHIAIELDRGQPEHSARHAIEAVVALRVAGATFADPDRYRRPPPPALDSKKPGVVTLLGVNYVSEHRRKAYEQALAAGISHAPIEAQARAPIDTPATAAPPAPMPAAIVETAATPTRPAEPTVVQTAEPASPSPASADASAPASPVSAMIGDLVESLPASSTDEGVFADEVVLALLQRMRENNAELHGDFIQLQRHQIDEAIVAVEHALEVSSSDPQQAKLIEDRLSENLRRIGDSQTRTAELHQAYLQSTLWLAERLGDFVDRGGSLKDGATPHERPVLVSEIEQPTAPLVIAEPAPAPAIRQIVEAPPPPVETVQSPVSSASNAVAASVDLAAVGERLLAVVAEKTGYPADALELSMDMEADLGIDSIKRVEILGAMQSAFPAFVPPGPEVLGELRTLQDILGLIASATTGVSANASESAPATVAIVETHAAAPAPVVSTPIASAPIETPVATMISTLAAASAASVDHAEVGRQLLAVVAEKTGYPADALELSMDMEADLGIDSIKRVEILGAMQSAFPAFVPPGPEVLGELRTLQDILGLIASATMTASASASAAVAIAATPVVSTPIASAPIETPIATTISTPAAASAASVDHADVGRQLLAVVAEKTGYPADALELSMDMEADLGIDSIKRVEILGAMQSAFPAFVPPGPEVLGELRTLQDILGLIASATAGTSANAAASDTSARSSVPAYPTVARYDQFPEALAAPDQLIGAFRENAHCLLVGDAGPLTLELAAMLSRQTMRVSLLTPQVSAVTGTLPANVRHVAANGPDPVALESTLATLGEIDAVVYVHPDLAEHGLATDSGGIERLKWLFMLAKLCKPRLIANSQRARAAFLAIGRLDGSWGLEGQVGGDLTAGAIPGLLKTFAAEADSVFCRALDLAPTLSASEAARIAWNELCDSDRSRVEIAWSERGRSGMTLRAPQAQAIAPDTENTVFVVTGGARGITAACVQALARRHRGRYLLLGRTRIEQEPQWAQGRDGEALKQAAIAYLRASGEKVTPKRIDQLHNGVIASREVQATLDGLESQGANAAYLDLDIAAPGAVASLLAHPMLASGAKIGLIHGAGALADKLIENKQLQDFERVFGPKIHGLSALLEALPAERVSHLWLFSSVAGMFGNIGQSDYAMANELLNRIAARYRRRHPECHVLSINWGAWNAGMVTPEVKAIFAQRGVPLIELEDGVALFADALTLSMPEHGVMLAGAPVPLSGPQGRVPAGQQWRIRRRTAGLAASALMRDHSIGGKAVLPAAFALGWIAQSAERMLNGRVFAHCESFQVLNGLVLDDKTPEACELILDVVRTTAEGDVYVDALLSSADGRPHYRAQALRFSPASALRPESTAPIAASDAHDAEGLYVDGTLFHGPQLRLLRSCASLPNERLLFVGARQPISDPRLLATHAADRYCPLTVDAALQAALAWVRRYEQLPSLPLAIAELASFGRPQGDAPFHVLVEAREKTSAGTRLALSVTSPSGELYLRALVSVVKSAALADKFVATRDPAFADGTS